jgi:cysteine-rich repeat protein
MLGKNTGVCQSLTCSSGTYLNKSSTSQISDCLPCNEMCKTCAGPSSFDCLSCHDEFILVNASKGIDGNCIQYPKGLTTKPDGRKMEKCGDGLNLGINECDDGNLIDSDGCSSTCKIEAGFECHTQENGTDLCRMTGNFIAKLKVEDDNKLKVVFNRQTNITSTSSF